MQDLIVKEYLGNVIEFKMVDGHVYANANKMAIGFGGGKKLENWKASPNTQRYIRALENSLKSSELNLINSEEGRNGGTWIHEKLILNFARYLNVEFELWCDEQIATLLREGNVSINPKQNLLLSIIQSETEVERAVALNKYEIEYVKPLEVKADYHDKVLKSDKLITVTNIAKDFGMSAVKLNKILHDLKVIYKKSNTWVLYEKYQDMIPKYCDYVINEYGQQLKWTELGRKFIIDLLDKNNMIK